MNIKELIREELEKLNEELPFDRSELGGALKEAIGNAVQEIL